MIRHASFKNFKSLRNLQIKLDRLTVFVGPNASGKSSILQGLDLLCQIFQVHEGGFPQNPAQMMNQQTSVSTQIASSATRGTKDPPEIAGEVGDKWFRYCKTPEKTSNQANFAVRPTPQNPPSDGREVTTHPIGSSVWAPWRVQNNTISPLPSSVLLRLETSKLVQATSIQGGLVQAGPATMAPDGTGLHSALASMALNDPDSWNRLQVDLKSIITSIRRLRFTKTTVPNQVNSLLFDTIGADDLQASQVSEGTLLVLGLLAALHAENRPSLVLLDDLDRGLHPKAQKELISLLRGLLESNQDLQILATTHSPYLLDSLSPSEVRMTFTLSDGQAVCAPLAQHPQFDKWKEEMSPGEMWSMFGEGWLASKGGVV